MQGATKWVVTSRNPLSVCIRFFVDRISFGNEQYNGIVVVGCCISTMHMHNKEIMGKMPSRVWQQCIVASITKFSLVF